MFIVCKLLKMKVSGGDYRELSSQLHNFTFLKNSEDCLEWFSGQPNSSSVIGSFRECKCRMNFRNHKIVPWGRSTVHGTCPCYRLPAHNFGGLGGIPLYGLRQACTVHPGYKATDLAVVL